MSAPPDVEFTAVMAVADRAMVSILGDRAVWAEEQQRVGAMPLSWPPKIEMIEPIGNHTSLMTALVITAVEMVLTSMIEAEPEAGEPVPADPRRQARLREIVDRLDPADPKVQWVLRVVNRAILAADAALCDQFGGKRGAHVVTGKRDFHNWIKAREVEAAVRSGEPRAAALGALPMSRAAAYRAMKRR